MRSDQSAVAADQPHAAPAPAADENMIERVRAVGGRGGTDHAVVAGAANNRSNRRGTTKEITPAAVSSATSEHLTEAPSGNTRDQGAPAVRGPVHAGEPAAIWNLPNRSEVTGEGQTYVLDLSAANNRINRRGTTKEMTPAAASSGTSEHLTEAASGNTRDQGAPAVRGPVHAGEPAAIWNLTNRSEVTGEGQTYVPDLSAPNSRFLPKEYETRVEVIHKIPEMKSVEETVFVKEITYEDRMVTVPRTKVIMEESVIIDSVPIIKQVPKTRIEIVHRIAVKNVIRRMNKQAEKVVEEPREVTELVEVVEYVEVPRVEKTPRIITEDVLESVHVPIVQEVPVKRQIEVQTGKYIGKIHNRYTTPGDMTLLRNQEQKHRRYMG